MSSSAGHPRLALVLWLTASGASAHAGAKVGASDLAGTSWQLVRFQGMDDTTRIPDDKAKYTLDFQSGGALAVRLDCNRGRGTWKSREPGQLELGPLALTRAMCPPGSLHDQIVKHWSYVRSYTLKDGHLFLSLMADGGIYEFERMASSPPPVMPEGGAGEPLESTYWKLTHLGDALVAVATPQKEPHLVLNAETRRVGGSGGCNRFTGSYELSGDALTFGPMAGTMMACLQGMETEKAFLESLGRVKHWKVVGRRLELLDAAGGVVARFEAVPLK